MPNLAARQLQTIQQQEKDDSAKVEIRNQLFIFLRSDLIAAKLSKRGVTCSLLKEMWEKFGEKLCISFFCTNDSRSKLSRDSKNAKKLKILLDAPQP